MGAEDDRFGHSGHARHVDETKIVLIGEQQVADLQRQRVLVQAGEDPVAWRADEELGADLPFATRALLFVATLFSTLWYIPFSIGGAFTAWLVWMFKTEAGRAMKDRLVLKLPIIRGIMEYAILERFCRILGAMVKAGVPLPDAMRTTTEATSNTVFRERLAEAQIEMMEGGGFAKPLARTELFPGAARQMFKVGEETGTLDEQLEVASLFFDRELESRIKKFTTMFEPLMIVFVGLVVGFVAIALVQAMYGVMDGLKDSA